MTAVSQARSRAATRIGTDAEALSVARELAAEFAVGAAERDRERRLPRAEIDRLSESGLLALTVPARFGGLDVRPSVLAEVVAILAAADASIAQIPHSHFVYLNLVRLSAGHALQERIFTDVLAGGRVANAQSERGGKTVADISTRLSPTDGGDGRFVLDGEKFYCTGSLFADTLAVLARLDVAAGDLVPGEYVAFIPADAAGVEIVDDWDAVGQRTTGSGTVRFTGVTVGVEDLVTRAPATSTPTGYGAFAQLLHVAIDVGIARGALREAAEFVRTKSRPWFEAEVDRAVDDPLVVQRFGELEVDVATAEATLAAAGRRVDTAVGAASGESGRAGVDASLAVAEASIAVATAKAVADRVATPVASALFEVSGTRSAAAGSGLDRYWRDARTHTLHDPVRWKYQHIGRWVLRGEEPPLHGVI
ncbi:SfnB family sulfur acquisition oxidoreductase [Gordonia terrae]|uniref:Dibenzothiophene monooxygenase n=2 Tax=Gordonia terrae TaxID=2055 RepID=A0AAD0K9Y5_9ACTN|nr:SfnB family sulfur acquisition oxidoreductase [Gordonia terrae]VTR07263.1 acyl-CoA dehydrogenase domain-containing protein [Clostridioides difficile]ANY22802.1 SfnB family sulfur acquisition oxidoreductase [Gordonia terrae]AWO83539.1 SfnB family sulfur acquisition oxidoreductase [Gordonia terrae]VTS42432.1 Flavin-dependent monooxygenase, oxygenase subunit HsaA [Gordonia terrae]GAB43427.1 putative FMNH2-dependent monooxygenase [Gordonia terrae NBRC 100016]